MWKLKADRGRIRQTERGKKQKEEYKEFEYFMPICI